VFSATLKTGWERAARGLRRALSDRRGVSAIEFALLAPALILLYVASVELGNALTISRRASAVASTATDLTAQVKTVATADLQDITSAATSILAPYSTTPLKIVLTSVVADQNNPPRVCWSYATNGGTALAKGAVVSLPAGLTQANSSVIMAKVTYAFTPLLGLTEVWSPGPINMTRTFYARPRKSLTVTKTDVPPCPPFN
jgi:Flp pilus assembly protein TadG